VWHYSILRAGLSVTPGPLVVAVVSGTAGKLAGRFGFRRILIAGFSVFTLGLLWNVWRVNIHPAYLADWLPGTLIVGLGIGFTFPVISAAAVSSLEPARYSVGSAVNQTARQIGGALGVAILVVILGTPTSLRVALEGFRHLWIFAASTAAIAGVICAFLARPVPHGAPRELDIDMAEGVEEMLDGEIAMNVRPSSPKDDCGPE
jgi:MFS family permease